MPKDPKCTAQPEQLSGKTIRFTGVALTPHLLQSFCTMLPSIVYVTTILRAARLNLLKNEKSVENELDELEASGFSFNRKKKVLSYKILEKLLRVTKNPDFFERGLSMQTAQHVVKSAVKDFESWTKAQKAYEKDPSKFLGKPKMPRYRKSDTRATELTNQDCTLSDGQLKFPLTDIRLKVDVPEKAKLKSVLIKPYYEDSIILCVYEHDKVIKSEDMPFSAGVDLGVDNIAAITTNEGNTLLFKGSAVKAENQYYNKERVRLTACMTKGHETKHVSAKSHKLSRLSQHRDSFSATSCTKPVLILSPSLRSTRLRHWLSVSTNSGSRTQ